MNAEATIVIHGILTPKVMKRTVPCLGKTSSTLKGELKKTDMQEHKDIVGIPHVRQVNCPIWKPRRCQTGLSVLPGVQPKNMPFLVSTSLISSNF